jgi:hypothetical protein
VAADLPDGIVIDSTGADHLHGGEKAMLGTLIAKLAGIGIRARCGRGHVGTAHALARYAARAVFISQAGVCSTDIAPLPIAALRLSADLVGFAGYITRDDCSAPARTHSDQQVAQIAASILEFGFTNPVLIDEEDGIIAGNGRVLAAHLLGLDEVPCIVLAHLTPTQRRAYVLADNKLALNAGWDLEMLSLAPGWRRAVCSARRNDPVPAAALSCPTTLVFLLYQKGRDFRIFRLKTTTYRRDSEQQQVTADEDRGRPTSKSRRSPPRSSNLASPTRC